MAPEQLEGRQVTAQSDIYALGLVLYEMFTGTVPFQAGIAAEVLRLRKESRVTNPSSVISDLDPAVERAIRRCLDPDPRKRPASALDLARSLPGGDPLAAALAAGETPSPDVVAASGSTEALRPAGERAGAVGLPRVPRRSEVVHRSRVGEAEGAFDYKSSNGVQDGEPVLRALLTDVEMEVVPFSL